MRKYNRALDYTSLALAHLMKGEPVMAARLMASAAAQPDCARAIQILEASNKFAFEQASKALTAGRKLLAMKEFPAELEADADEEYEDEEDQDDPLNDVEDDIEVEADADEEDPEEDEDEDEEVDAEFDDEDDEDPGVVMSKVLAKMTRKPAKRR